MRWNVVNQGMQEKQSITVRCMDIEDLEKQAEAIRVEQIKLYESYADGVLLRDAYIEKKNGSFGKNWLHCRIAYGQKRKNRSVPMNWMKKSAL